MAREVDRERVRGLMEQGAQIIDVLPAQDYGEDHLPGAINLPLRRIEAEARILLETSAHEPRAGSRLSGSPRCTTTGRAYKTGWERACPPKGPTRSACA